MKMHCGKFLKARFHHGRHHFNENRECDARSGLECESEGTSSESSCSPSFDKLKHHNMSHDGHKMVHFGRKVGRKFGHHGHKKGHQGHKMGHHGHKIDHHGLTTGHHGDEMSHHGHNGHKMGPHGHEMRHKGHKVCHQERSNMGHHGNEEGSDKINHHRGKKHNKRGYRGCDFQTQKNAIISNPEKFEIILSVKQFKPDEVSVKAVNNSIIVDCNHAERELRNQFISRHIVRRFEVPAGYDLEIIQSELSADGILRVAIPKIQNVATVERVIPVIVEDAPINQSAQEELQVISE